MIIARSRRFVNTFLYSSNNCRCPQLLFTLRPSTCCLVWAKECGLPCIRPFAKGELPMGRMPLLFTVQPLFGWGVKSNCPQVAIHGLGAAHSNLSGRYWKFASQNRPSLLNHVLTECAVYAHSWPVNSNVHSYPVLFHQKYRQCRLLSILHTSLY